MLPETQRKTIKDLILLVSVCLGVGAYLIVTTVVISVDGVIYVERAQQLTTNFGKIVNLNEPPGLPILVWGFHALTQFDNGSDSLARWIYAGQVGVLCCTAAAVITLYLLGRTWFDAKTAFWGVLVLIMLPYPAHWGADILRDWPHVFLLFAGLLLLYRAIERQRSIMFLGAGLVSGLGYVVRPECAQVVLYGAVLFVLQAACAFRRKEPIGKAWKYAFLAFGFLSVFLLLASQQKRVVPDKLDELLNVDATPAAGSMTSPLNEKTVQQAGGSGILGMIEAIGNLLKGLSENLLYYFTVPAAIGFYLFVKESRSSMQRLFIGMILVFYTIVLLTLDMRWGYISRRHLLPLTAIFCFFIPAGTEWLARRLFAKQWRMAFYVLIGVGLLICTPKLLRPPGYDKKTYREAARWVADHTPANAAIYSCDNRIPFYAERPYHFYRQNKVSRLALKSDYWIVLSKDGRPQLTIPARMKLEQRFELKDGKELLIYGRARH